jgi:hypothetical protein
MCDHGYEVAKSPPCGEIGHPWPANCLRSGALPSPRRPTRRISVDRPTRPILAQVQPVFPWCWWPWPEVYPLGDRVRTQFPIDLLRRTGVPSGRLRYRPRRNLIVGLMRRSGIAAGRQADNKSGGHDGITDSIRFPHVHGLPWLRPSNRFGRSSSGRPCPCPIAKFRTPHPSIDDQATSPSVCHVRRPDHLDPRRAPARK